MRCQNLNVNIYLFCPSTNILIYVKHIVNIISITDYTGVNRKLFIIPETFISYISLTMGYASEILIQKKRVRKRTIKETCSQ